MCCNVGPSFMHSAPPPCQKQYILALRQTMYSSREHIYNVSPKTGAHGKGKIVLYLIKGLLNESLAALIVSESYVEKTHKTLS